MQTEPQPKIGTFKRGWILTKVSWRVLRLNSRLINFSILNVLVSLLIVGLFVGVAFAIIFAAGDWQAVKAQYNDSGVLPSWAYPLIFLMLLPLFIVMNYFTACITAGALQQFRGQSPTFKSSFREANKIAGSIIEFSFYQDLAIWIIDLLRRIKFIGPAMAFLGELAFAVGTFFALPVLIDGQGKVSPLGAIKQSAELIKKTWGESIIINLGMTLWAILAGVLYTVVWGIAGIALVIIRHFFVQTSATSDVGSGTYIGAAVMIATLAIGYGVIMVIYSALSTIATSAIYIYATTGKTPDGFDSNVLKQSLRPKTSSDI